MPQLDDEATLAVVRALYAMIIGEEPTRHDRNVLRYLLEVGFEPPPDESAPNGDDAP